MRRLALAACLLAVPALAQDVAPGRSPGASASASSGDTATLMRGWTAAPAHVALFAPAAHRAAYQAYVRPEPQAPGLPANASRPGRLPTPGGWSAAPELPAAAFGESGRYDRWAVARLYGARRPLVARGPRVDDGTVTESWTLVSPYPDAALRELSEGTLLIVLRMP